MDTLVGRRWEVIVHGNSRNDNVNMESENLSDRYELYEASDAYECHRTPGSMRDDPQQCKGPWILLTQKADSEGER